MGHARTYLTFDILRRVLEDYFNYDMLYVMNITDIDDKIILRARQNFLVEEFKKKSENLSEDLVNEVRRAWVEYAESTVLDSNIMHEIRESGLSSNFLKYQELVEKNKSLLEKEIGEKFSLYCKTIEKVHAELENVSASSGRLETAAEFISECKDVLAPYLDSKYGRSVTDHGIFQKLTQYWEAEYFKDMERLNVKPPDVLTRVTEYVPEVINFVKKIQERGYAYESEGSVYFDVDAFKQKHDYAKLAPWAAGHSGLLAEGEGSLGIKLGGKKSVFDFALWKSSKPGEPSWESPWGKGRPGWHIECSVMASDVTGDQLDIHSGGVDLCFPHHDNELAQSEAFYDSQQWVNYFLHSGHLHIEGQKMSKSLKNFITIQEALEKYSGTQIRIMILLHSWNAVLDYKDDSMAEAVSVEKSFRNFFENIKALLREQKLSTESLEEGTLKHNHRSLEKDLIEELLTKQKSIHAALCDSINTPQAMNLLLELVNKTNVHIRDKSSAGEKCNTMVLSKVASYITKMLRIFGVIESKDDKILGFPATDLVNGSAQSSEEQILPYLNVLSKFRDQIRDLARDKASHLEFLKACDNLRDNILPPIGVSLEDKTNASSIIKLMPPELIMAEQRKRSEREEEKKKAKQERERLAFQKKLEKLEKGRIAPNEMFKLITNEMKNLSLEGRHPYYSEWDEQGIPTKDASGEPLAKSRRKKLQKEFDMQKKLHQEFLAAVSRGEFK